MARARTGPAALKLTPAARRFILRKRAQRDPVPYRQIVEMVRERYGIEISLGRVYGVVNEPESPGENVFGILTKAEVREARRLRKKGHTLVEIAERYKVDKGTVGRAMQTDYVPSDG